MIIKATKHLQISTIVIMFLVLVNAGCAQLEQKASGNTKRINTLEENADRISEIKNMLQDIQQQLTLIEVNKIKTLEERLGTHSSSLQSLDTKSNDLADELNEIKTKLIRLESLYAESAGVTGGSNKTSIKETPEKQDLSFALSDEAIEYYRQGQFEEAIKNWKEVLNLDPANLEAKFNIEIAKDRLEVRKIQEELKARRIQRK